jgi:hypothetical protein
MYRIFTILYLQNWVIFRVNVGKYSSTMEHLGNVLLSQPSVSNLGVVNNTGALRHPAGETLRPLGRLVA